MTLYNFRVVVLHFRRFRLEVPPEFSKPEQLSEGVTRVTTTRSRKVMEDVKTEGSTSYEILAVSYEDAARQAVDKFKADPTRQYNTKHVSGGMVETRDYGVNGVEIFFKDLKKIRWMEEDLLQPDWWVEVQERARFMVTISGGGVIVNLDPRSGHMVASPIPLPPIPPPPFLSDERRKEILDEVRDPFYWKYPTMAKRVNSFKEAMEYAWSIEYFTGGAEIWSLPDGMGYAVTSKGYFHYSDG